MRLARMAGDHNGRVSRLNRMTETRSAWAWWPCSRCPGSQPRKTAQPVAADDSQARTSPSRPRYPAAAERRSNPPRWPRSSNGGPATTETERHARPVRSSAVSGNARPARSRSSTTRSRGAPPTSRLTRTSPLCREWKTRSRRPTSTAVRLQDSRPSRRARWPRVRAVPPRRLRIENSLFRRLVLRYLAAVTTSPMRSVFALVDRRAC